MSEAFDKCWALTLGNEGKFSDDPQDPGNWYQGKLEGTMWGITAAVARRWGYTGAMKDLPQSTAKEIAIANYWSPFGCEYFPVSIAFQVFDTAYNGGHPLSWLQGILQTTATGSDLGIILNMANSWEIVAKFNARRLQYLASLKQPQYANGRMNRIATNMTQGGSLK